MKINNLFTVLFAAVILASCAPTAKVVPTETAVPTSTSTLSPKATITPTFFPAINRDGQIIPDPHFSNPDFFDASNASSPIVQFANALDLSAEEVSAGLKTEMETPDGLPAFVVVRTSDGVALMMATQNTEGEWTWEKATPGRYWFAQGKRVGIYLDGDKDKYPGNVDLMNEYFTNGIFALSGQVRPNAGRTPERASRPASEAKSNNMALFFSYVVEPGKFPDDVSTENVDMWLDIRFEGIIKLLTENRTEGQPMYVSFNEAWEGNSWNEEKNPLREKYGEQWVSKYTYQLLSKFINSGLVPNEDFIIIFNDANLYNRPNKQDLLFNKLTEARLEAFNKLNSDPATQTKLREMKINTPENIDILVGVQNHIKLGQNIDDGNFIPEPTEKEIEALANKFSSLGGIIMSEFNPNGTKEQQSQFLKKSFVELKSNPNIRAILLWNVFEPNDLTDIFSTQRLELFDEAGAPTKLLFELLR